MILPNVFAGCCTFGRPQCVANIIAQWEAMEYVGSRELIILDDGGQYPTETAGDNWQIISINRRFASLGEKSNALFALSKPEHDLLMVVEDDDVYLPHTIQAHIDAFQRAPISIPSKWYMELRNGSLRFHESKSRNNAHAGWAFSRDVFRRVGGYPNISVPHDHGLLTRFQNAGFDIADPTRDFPPFLISRFLTSTHLHLSQAGQSWETFDRELQPVYGLPTAQSFDFSAAF